jgi:hypothetical protein
VRVAIGAFPSTSRTAADLADQQHRRCSRKRQRNRDCIPDYGCDDHKHLWAKPSRGEQHHERRKQHSDAVNSACGARTWLGNSSTQQCSASTGHTQIQTFACSSGQAHAPCSVCTHSARVAHAGGHDQPTDQRCQASSTRRAQPANRTSAHCSARCMRARPNSDPAAVMCTNSPPTPPPRLSARRWSSEPT